MHEESFLLALIFNITHLFFISTFSSSTADVPEEFAFVFPSSASMESQRQDFIFDSALNSLFAAVLKGSVGRCEKIMLDCAMRSLLGAYDHKIVKSAFRDAKGTRTNFKMPHSAKVALALDRASTQCLERLRRADPNFSSFTVSGLLSFVSKGKLCRHSYMLCIIFLNQFLQFSKMKLRTKFRLI